MKKKSKIIWGLWLPGVFLSGSWIYPTENFSRSYRSFARFFGTNRQVDIQNTDILRFSYKANFQMNFIVVFLKLIFLTSNSKLRIRITCNTKLSLNKSCLHLILEFCVYFNGQLFQALILLDSYFMHNTWVNRSFAILFHILSYSY